MTRDQIRSNQIRSNLGELEFLNWEAVEDVAGDEEFMTEEEREELEAELEREIPQGIERV